MAISIVSAKETHAMRRDRRETLVDDGVARVTLMLRALAEGDTSSDHARRVRDRYARMIGVRAGVGGDGFVQFLRSADAAALDIDEIDAVMMRLARQEDQDDASAAADELVAGMRAPTA